jgi:UDP-GlcNAc:undecaprenyl-phosphate/decaprenyl-phosphate GlcNAc-1-phosphate transferase
MFSLVPPFLISLLVVFFITPVVILLAKKYRLVDDPKNRFHPAHTHTGIVPRAGGLALFVGIVLAICLFLPNTSLKIGLILSACILTVVGLLDDRKDIPPATRLITNAIACTIAVVAGATIPYITNPLGAGVIRLDVPLLTVFGISFSPVSMLLSFVWIYWTMNIVGWSAGVDGQLPGVVVIAAMVLGVLSLRYPEEQFVTILSVIITGSFLGFLPWNFFPQKIMPGYGGKTLAGFFLAVIGIFSYAKLGTALLVLGIPMLDALFILLRRIIKHKSPLKADRGHLHHYLLDLGLSRRLVALTYWLMSAILGTIALTVNSKQKVFAFLFATICFGGFLLWVQWALRSLKQRDPDSG